jgi:methyl-accepting chemotaxis protein
MSKKISLSNILNKIKELKFVRKIQLGFLLIAVVSAAIAVNNFLQLDSFEKQKDMIFDDYISPKEKIANVYSEFQKIQFIMLKLSMEEFSDNIEQDIEIFQQKKADVDTLLAGLENMQMSDSVEAGLVEVNKIWENYKNVVADAILSAAATKNYEMAAVFATTSGEEVGSKLIAEFDSITDELNNNANTLNAGVDADINSSKLFIIIGMIFGTVIFIFSVFYLAPAISKPVNKLKTAVTEFSLGNYEAEVNITSNDEFGELADQLTQMRDAQREKIFAAEQIARGKMEKVTPSSDKDTLSIAFNKEVENIDSVLKEAEGLIKANQEGDLSYRGNEEKFSGAWKEIITGINSIMDTMKAPINEAGKVLNVMASGDFTQKVEGDYKGDYKKIKDDVNKVVESLNNAITKVAENASQLASSSSQISSSTEQMAAGAQEQNSQTSEVASSIEEMSKTIVENTENANTASKSASQNGDRAKQGGEIVSETIEGINRIAEIVIKSANTIKALGKSSDEIGKIVQVINDIAEQTNLLALNAAIEAARAGEQGRGFAVVADEVRKLAERTTKATKEIEEMITNIQTDTAEAVEVIDKGTKEVEQGKELAGKAGSSLEEIISNSEEVSDLIGQLAAASEQQASTSEEISKNVEAISNVTQQSAKGTEQISRAAEDLYKLTESLQEVINYFTLNQRKQSSKTNNGNNSDVYVNGNGKIHG